MKILLKSNHVLPSSHGLEFVVQKIQLQRLRQIRDVVGARVFQKPKRIFNCGLTKFARVPKFIRLLL